VIAIDALNYQKRWEQFYEVVMKRELNKAFAGFWSAEKEPPPVATGLWGCGAFGGNPELKALIQMMAASLAGRRLVFFAYNTTEFYEHYKNFLEFLAKYPELTVGSVFKILSVYCDRVNGTGIESRGFDDSVFEFCVSSIERDLGERGVKGA